MSDPDAMVRLYSQEGMHLGYATYSMEEQADGTEELVLVDDRAFVFHVKFGQYREVVPIHAEMSAPPSYVLEAAADDNPSKTKESEPPPANSIEVAPPRLP